MIRISDLVFRVGESVPSTLIIPFLSLSACGAEFAHVGQMTDQGTVAGNPVPPPPPDSARVIQVPTDASHDATRFDLLCDVHGRVLADPYPDEHRSSPMLSNDPWHRTRRIVVDLEAMQYCGDPASCARLGPARIVALNPQHIVFYDEPGVSWTVRRNDGLSRFRMVMGHRIQEEEGNCRRDGFSGFPAREVVAPETQAKPAK